MQPVQKSLDASNELAQRNVKKIVKRKKAS